MLAWLISLIFSFSGPSTPPPAPSSPQVRSNHIERVESFNPGSKGGGNGGKTIIVEDVYID